MRLHFNLSPSKTLVPFDHLPGLVGALHKWIGQNNIHNDLSLYSFSWLKGGGITKWGLNFKYGASFFISAFDDSLLKQIIMGIQAQPEINWGMEVRDIIIEETPTFSEKERFQVASPVLIKRRIGEREHHFKYSDAETNNLLTETLQHKLNKAGLADNSLNVRFDEQFAFPKTKKVNYKGIGNIANICPIIIEGKPESIAFAWNVGIGNSTGIGLGALK